MATPGALANLDVDHVLWERIANGEIAQQIASQLGVHHSNLYRKLAQHPEYPAAREAGLAARLDKAEYDVETADERTLPRARELWRVVTWRAERECPARWGQLTKIAGADGGPLQVQVVRFGATIEGETVADVPIAALAPAILTDKSSGE